MNKRTVEVSLKTARKLYKSGDKALKEVVLQAFSEGELTSPFRDIKNIHDAIEYLKSNKMCSDLIEEYNCAPENSYTETLAAYRIVVAALTNNEKRKLKFGNSWVPVVQFCVRGVENASYGKIKLGTIKCDGEEYVVTGGSAYFHTSEGLGNFSELFKLSNSWMDVGFRSVSSKEVAEYISEQFGRLLFEVHYGGVNCDWEWID